MMTEERLRQLCDFVELLDKHEIDAEAAKMGHEMLDEIKRLKAALRRIADSPTIGDGNDASTLREWAANAMGWIDRKPGSHWLPDDGDEEEPSDDE